MLKKFKKFYKNNRIYCILMIVSILCILLMSVSVVVYFVSQASSSSYGDRLDGIEEYDLGSSLDEIEDYYKGQTGVLSAEARLQGKIIYINVEVEDSIDNEKIQNMATASLEVISEENRAYYEMQFIFTRESYNPYFGSKNANNTYITWANYSYDTEDEEEEE